MPIGVFITPSWVSGAMPLAPTKAGMPTRTGSQPAAVRWNTSTLADEPPSPTTEITWVALPTFGANHGVYSAWLTGAAARYSTVAQSRTRKRRTHPMLGGDPLSLEQATQPGRPFRLLLGRGVGGVGPVEEHAGHSARLLANLTTPDHRDAVAGFVEAQHQLARIGVLVNA